MIARKDWQEDLLYFVYWINKINKQMKYLAGWRVVIWSAVNLVWPMAWRCCWVTLSAMVVDSTAHVTSACPIHIPNFKHRPQKILFAKKKKKKKKNDWLKNRPFFYNWKFSGDLNGLCVEPMCRNNDFLCLTLAIVGSTSSRYYFLLQCLYLSVCVLCFRS